VAKLFEVFGPYPIDRDAIFDSKWQREAWESVDDEVGAALSGAIGIYVYSLHNRGSYKPMYVGVTTKQIFRKEVFNQRNLRMVSQLNSKNTWQKGTLYLHLLAKRKEKHNGFAIPNRDWLIALESLMIFICRRKNPDLLNKKHTVWLDGVGISGVTAADAIKGKPSKAISSLRNVMDW
jgi:hypothetical protein